MSNLTTELMNALLKNDSIDEFFRQHLEKAVNDILQAELSSFLGYQKYDFLDRAEEIPENPRNLLQSGKPVLFL